MIKLLFSYLKEKRWTIVQSLFFLLIFYIILDLYHVELEVFLYAALLCLFLSLFCFAFRFSAYVRAHRERLHQKASIEHSFQNLPVPQSLSEQDYQDMILVLGQRCNALATAFQTEQQESLDYYTTWAHQIKTPIAVMQMMLQAEDTEEHRALSAELFRIEQYVEMVLSYIRLGSESSDLIFHTCPLDPLIRQSIRKYAPLFIRKKIRLVYHPTQTEVLTDEKWLTFILEQLLSNAVKYTYHGQVTLTVSPEKVLTIQDTGIGIASEDLPRIFEKGFTGYNGRTDKKSTGLGLYLCKQAADKLGIQISVTSQPKKGSSFSLDLSSRHLEIE